MFNKSFILISNMRIIRFMICNTFHKFFDGLVIMNIDRKQFYRALLNT